MKNLPELRFKEFSGKRKEEKLKDVEWVELSEVAEVIAGQSPEGKYYNVTGEGMPFHQGKTEFTNMYLGKPRMWTKKITKIAEQGDILMSVRAPVGPVNITTEEICIGRGLASIRANKIGQIFLFHYLKSIEDKVSGNGGAVFDSISKKQIEELKIKLPCKQEQQKIASFLSAIDKKIELTDKRLEYLESYKKGLMQKLLTGEIRFPGFNDEWKQEKLEDILTEYNEKNINNYRQYTIGKNGIFPINNSRYNIINHKIFKLNNLILGIGIDEININTNILKGSCSPIYKVCKINTDILNPKFGSYYIKIKINKEKNKICKKSSRREFEIIYKNFLELKIKLPCKQEQQKIASFLSAIDKKIELTKSRLENLKSYKKGLLQKMFV